MDRKYNAQLTQNAKMLRKNMTKEERHLWYDFLKDYPVRFLRQKVIDQYIVDFYCHEAKLIIELAGSQHYDEVTITKDAVRTKTLKNGVYLLFVSQTMRSFVTFGVYAILLICLFVKDCNISPSQIA